MFRQSRNYLREEILVQISMSRAAKQCFLGDLLLERYNRPTCYKEEKQKKKLQKYYVVLM